MLIFDFFYKSFVRFAHSFLNCYFEFLSHVWFNEFLNGLVALRLWVGVVALLGF